MKRTRLITICFMVMILIISSIPCAANAGEEAETDFILEQSAKEASSGKTLEVILNGSNLKDLYAYEAIISYDPDVVELDKAESKLEGFFIPPKTDNGKMIIAFTKIGKKKGESGNVPLSKIVFKGKAQGDPDIKLVSVKALDPDLTAVSYSWTEPEAEEKSPEKSEAIPAVTFTDLDGYPWAKMQIETLAGQGIIKGTSKTTFSPGANITRADFICLLVRALGFSAEIDSNFSDAEQSDYFYKEVGIARKLGIVQGVGNNMLMPREYISRQDMMVIVSRALELSGEKLEGSASDLEGFSDCDEVALYAKDAVGQLVSGKIILGSGGRINPKGTATRAETAVIIYRILNR